MCLTQQQQQLTPPHTTQAIKGSLRAPVRKAGLAFKKRRASTFPHSLVVGAGHLGSWSPGSVCSTRQSFYLQKPMGGGGFCRKSMWCTCRIQTAPTCPRLSGLKTRQGEQRGESGCVVTQCSLQQTSATRRGPPPEETAPLGSKRN